MVLRTKAQKESWPELRAQAEHKASTKAAQKTAEAAADNATLAADIKKRLLMRVSRLEQKFPEDGTEIQTVSSKGRRVTFRLKELTAAYRDLVDDKTIDINLTMGKFDALDAAFKAMKSE